MYLSLRSDASQEIYPGNTIGDFTVRLPGELNFEHDSHQIALVSMSYPFSFKNIRESYVVFGANTAEAPPPVGVTLEAGYYETTQSLLADLNRSMNKAFAASVGEPWRDGENVSSQCYAVLRLNSSGKVMFRLRPRGHEVPFVCHLPKNLYVKLGFALKWTKDRYTHTGEVAEYEPDLNAGIGSLFVYCDAMSKSRFVGPVMLSLLRIIPVSGTRDMITHYQPKTLEYFKLNVNHFSEVTIHVRDELGRTIEFTAGKICVDLHIKKRSVLD